MTDSRCRQFHTALKNGNAQPSVTVMTPLCVITPGAWRLKEKDQSRKINLYFENKYKKVFYLDINEKKPNRLDKRTVGSGLSTHFYRPQFRILIY